MKIKDLNEVATNGNQIWIIEKGIKGYTVLSKENYEQYKNRSVSMLSCGGDTFVTNII
jgi:hypothetical protein